MSGGKLTHSLFYLCFSISHLVSINVMLSCASWELLLLTIPDHMFYNWLSSTCWEMPHSWFPSLQGASTHCCRFTTQSLPAAAVASFNRAFNLRFLNQGRIKLENGNAPKNTIYGVQRRRKRSSYNEITQFVPICFINQFHGCSSAQPCQQELIFWHLGLDSIAVSVFGKVQITALILSDEPCLSWTQSLHLSTITWMNFAILNQTLSLKPLFSQYLRKGNLEPKNLLVLKIFLQRCWIKFAKLVGGVTLSIKGCHTGRLQVFYFSTAEEIFNLPPISLQPKAPVGGKDTFQCFFRVPE